MRASEGGGWTVQIAARFCAGPFRVTPAVFYLQQGEETEIAVEFTDSTGLDLGLQQVQLELEGDNHTTQSVVLQAYVETVQMSLVSFDNVRSAPADLPSSAD